LKGRDNGEDGGEDDGEDEELGEEDPDRRRSGRVPVKREFLEVEMREGSKEKGKGKEKIVKSEFFFSLPLTLVVVESEQDTIADFPFPSVVASRPSSFQISLHSPHHSPSFSSSPFSQTFLRLSSSIISNSTSLSSFSNSFQTSFHHVRRFLLHSQLRWSHSRPPPSRSCYTERNTWAGSRLGGRFRFSCFGSSVAGAVGHDVQQNFVGE